jgi:HSP20 family protein
MALVHWRPRTNDPFELLRREMDHMLERYFGGWPEEGGQQQQTMMQGWTPRIDVKERDKDIVIKADLPGVNPKDVDITIENDTLILRGHREEEKEHTEGNVHRVERFSGRFFREIPLPPGTDVNQVEASSAHGVLTITVPKKAEVQPRRIQVKAAEGGHGEQASAQHKPATETPTRQPQTEASGKKTQAPAGKTGT